MTLIEGLFNGSDFRNRESTETLFGFDVVKLQTFLSDSVERPEKKIEFH